MIETAKHLIPAAIAFSLAFGAAGAANARVVDINVRSPVYSAAADAQAGPEIVKTGFAKKRFWGKHVGRHHHRKRLGFRTFGHGKFGHRGYGQKHFRYHYGPGYVVKNPYFGKRGGIYFKKRARRHH